MTGSIPPGYEGRRVLVTGAAGFVGRHVVAGLRKEGATVFALVRPGPIPGWLTRDAGVRPITVDLRVTGLAAEVVTHVKPAITFNLAGYGVDPTEQDTTAAERLNAGLPAELAAACVAASDLTWPGQHLVHAGSALEYGTTSGSLEEDSVAAPTTLYGATKLAGTQAVRRAADDSLLRAVTARLFTVYGPGEHPGRLLPSLVRAARSGAPLELTDGQQRRDFTFVGEVAEGLLRLGRLGAEASGIVNVASGTLTTVRAFVERAAAILGITDDQLHFGMVPTRRHEMAHDPVSITRLVALCGWRPGLSIEEGVRRTIAAGQSAPE